MPGGSGSLITSEPMSPSLTCLPCPSSTCTSYPHTARVGDPALTGSCSMPMQLAAIAQPVSVCHQ